MYEGASAFSVAIRLRLIDGVSAGIIGLSRQFAKGNVEAKALQGRIDGIKRTLAVGAGLSIAGAGIVKLVESTLPAAREYANQLSLMNTLGMRQADVAKAVGQAWQTTFQVPTTSITENLKSFRELRSAFGAGRDQEAAAMLPTVGRIQSLLTALTGREQDKVGFDLVKAIELRSGVMTTAQLQRNADMMAQTLTAFGGTLTVADFHGALKMGKLATQKWDDEFTFKYLPTFMQELKTAHGGGAQSAGTALMSLYQAVNGRLAKAAMPLWVQSGLVAQSDIVKNATGQFQMKPGAVRGYQEEAADPYKWVQTYLRPAIDRVTKARGITAEAAINSMFQNRNAAFAAYTFYNKARQFERDKRTVDQAQGIGAYNQLLKTNPQLAEQALQKQWTNIKAQIGFTLMPDLMKAASALIPQLVKLSEWINKNPAAIGGWVKGFAAVGALLTVAGGITLAAGFVQLFKLLFDVLKVGAGLSNLGGMIAAGFELVEVAFAGLAIAIGVPVGTIVAVGAAVVGAFAAIGVGIYQMWKHWDNSRSVFENIRAEFGMFIDWLTRIPGMLFNMLPSWARNMIAPTAKPNAAATPKPTFLQSNGRLDVKAVMNWSKNAFGPASAHAHEAGQAVGAGVAAGITAAHPVVRAAAIATVGQGVNAFKIAADIHSPSRVFAGLGDMLVQGLILGVDRSSPGLMARLAELGRSVTGSMHGLGGADAGFTQKLTSSVAERASQAMAFFRAHGWSGAQAAGIVANLVRESGLNNTAVNRNSGAFGAAQWLGARVANFAAVTGHALRGSSLLQQLAFVDHELHTSHARVGRALQAARTAGDAAALIDRRFEINGVFGEAGRRAALAAQLAGTQTRSPFIAHRPHETVVHTRTVLDGRVLTETVTRHQTREAGRPHAGVSTFDHTMSPAPVGLGYHP